MQWITLITSVLISAVVSLGAVYLVDEPQAWFEYSIIRQQSATRNGTVMTVDPVARTLMVRAPSTVVANSESITSFTIPADTYIAKQPLNYDDVGSFNNFGELVPMQLADITPGSFVSIMFDKNAGGPILARSILVQFLAVASTTP